jgi:hypothetical protein
MTYRELFDTLLYDVPDTIEIHSYANGDDPETDPYINLYVIDLFPVYAFILFFLVIWVSHGVVRFLFKNW